MSSIIKVNTYQDANGNALFSSDGSGNLTLSASAMQNTPSFQATRSANQTITQGSNIKVQFDSEIFDTNNAYDHTTNYRFTIPSGLGGKYFISSRIRLLWDGSNGLGRYILYLFKNGSNYAYHEYSNTNNDTKTFTHNLSLIGSFSAGDYFEIYVYQESNAGSFQTIQSSINNSSFQAMKLIGA